MFIDSNYAFCRRSGDRRPGCFMSASPRRAAAYPHFTRPLAGSVACLPNTAKQARHALSLLTAEHGTDVGEEKCGGPRRILEHG
jgi:isochorismate synthase EntC